MPRSKIQEKLLEEDVRTSTLTSTGINGMDKAYHVEWKSSKEFGHRPLSALCRKANIWTSDQKMSA